MKNLQIVRHTVLLLFFLGAIFLGLSAGSSGASISDLWAPESEIAGRIMWQLRIPRVLTGLLVGGALAVAGATLQGVLRNDLASPDLLGVSGGGGLMVVLGMIYLPQISIWIMPMAFGGALVAALAVYLLAWQNGVRPLRLILSGVAVGALLGALTGGILILNADKVAGVLPFLTGTLGGANYVVLNRIWPYIIGGTLVLVFFSGELNILALGDTMAKSLGMKIELIRAILIAMAALLSASAVCAAGMLGFAGLITPHIVRLIFGGDYRKLLLYSIFLGGALVVLCDGAGRLISPERELPCGVLMALLGAPFFLYLLRKSERAYHEN